MWIGVVFIGPGGLSLFFITRYTMILVMRAVITEDTRATLKPTDRSPDGRNKRQQCFNQCAYSAFDILNEIYGYNVTGTLEALSQVSMQHYTSPQSPLSLLKG